MPVFIVLLALFTSLPALARLTDDANRLYQTHQAAIYQIRIIEKSSGNKASLGSGFQISADGRVASNYHVVAEAVKKPDGYRIEYLAADGSHGNMRLLAVDVVNDLALLQRDPGDTPFLPLHVGRLRKGTRIFSLGNPHDLGMTVVEGTYNGLVDHTLYQRVLFTGSLNPGMSGGPTLDREGEVVGINVSTAGNQISFLVPVKHLRRLNAAVTDGAAVAETAAGWDAVLTQQLLQHQDRYMTALLARNWQAEPLGAVTVPTEIAPYVKCWGDRSDDKDALYQVTSRTCHVDESLFLGNGLDTGSFRLQYRWFETETLNPVRFYAQMEGQFFQDINNSADKDAVTPYACEDDFVTLHDHTWKVHWCARRYKRFPALHDVSVSLAALVAGQQGMLVSFALAGVSRDNALKITRRLLESVQWKS